LIKSDKFFKLHFGSWQENGRVWFSFFNYKTVPEIAFVYSLIKAGNCELITAPKKFQYKLCTFEKNLRFRVRQILIFSPYIFQTGPNNVFGR
jgi:hypothetical protein